ncbi:formyl-CoA transferase [Thermus scotoductus]|uniref:Formyl-CoA transferase n=2 Tax=Thermus scotoductus TaxID=37636 RepID=A0A430S2M0_THESC|nr:formyl-CoA transferase [Thermus scotoductus]RTH27930.1 formyl-CoA transferase [Thermus scotoductus]
MGSPALEGLRVVEVGSLLAGPFCGQLLGDLGAEVIKIEPPGSGDPMRNWGHKKVGGRGLWWPIIARNKKSITLDLRQREGQMLARRLIAKADILIENFRPGTMERWGLGYDVLSKENPGLIMVRVSGFGQTGSYSQHAGFGSVAEAMGGLRYLTGYPDRPPTRVGISIGDALAGTLGALGALAALWYRDARGGRGQVIDVAIYEAVLAYMESLIPEYALTGYIRERTGPVLPGVAPSNIYPTADGQWLVMGANADTVFRRLCQAMGRPELAEDPRFATHDARAENMELLDSLISEWTATRPIDDLLETLHEAGVPAGKIYTARDMLEDPHFLARQAIVKVNVPGIGEMPMQNVFPKLSLTPGEVRWPGPELGEHNREIFCGLLGLTEDELAELKEKGVI